MPRAYWNGFLKLSFVSCPVALYPATSAAERVSFRQVNRRTGHRLKHRLVDSVTGETVEFREKARGYEVDENRFLLIEDRELEQARRERPRPGAVQLAEPPRPASAATPACEPDEDGEAEKEEDCEDDGEKEEVAEPVPRPQNTRTIEVERFVPAGQVDLRYFEKPYYIVPRDVIGQEAFAVIRDAMSREDVAGLARVVLSSRERPMLVAPMGKGLCGVTLRFTDDNSGRRGIFQRNSGDEAAGRNVEARAAHHPHEGHHFRSLDAGGSLSERTRADLKKKTGEAAPRCSAGCALEGKCRQPDGRFEAKHCGTVSCQEARSSV